MEASGTLRMRIRHPKPWRMEVAGVFRDANNVLLDPVKATQALIDGWNMSADGQERARLDTMLPFMALLDLLQDSTYHATIGNVGSGRHGGLLLLTQGVYQYQVQHVSGIYTVFFDLSGHGYNHTGICGTAEQTVRWLWARLWAREG